MKRKILVTIVFVLIVSLTIMSTGFAAGASKFSVKYDCRGKVVMSNFDSDIGSYESEGVYQSTGSGTKSISYYVCPQQIAIVGGYKMNGLEKGIYKVVGPGTYTESITDGFVVVVDKSVAAKEWQFRLYQVKQNKWAIKYFWGTYLLN